MSEAELAVVTCAKDPYGREVKSLRLSVTQRCNFTCSHCHGEGQGPSLGEMSPAEMERMVRIAVSLGVRKVKVTGGEPLLREDILDIISRISPLVKEVSLTTNGTGLARLAVPLKQAGLSRVNVSLHTLDQQRFDRLCGADLSEHVNEGIQTAVRAGLNPVKVNMVIFRGENDMEVRAMMDFCAKSGAVLQLIELEACKESSTAPSFASRFYSLKQIEDVLSKEAMQVTENELHRRRRYTVKANGGIVTVEVVRPMHNTEFCANCTRIRMTSDGLLKPCLLDPSGNVDALTPLRAGSSDNELRQVFLAAVANRRPYWR